MVKCVIVPKKDFKLREDEKCLCKVNDRISSGNPYFSRENKVEQCRLKKGFLQSLWGIPED